jgi:hypothetical protein
MLNHLESCLLSVCEPQLNAQGPRWKGAQEYWQYEGEDYDLDDPFRRFAPARTQVSNQPEA